MKTQETESKLFKGSTALMTFIPLAPIPALAAIFLLADSNTPEAPIVVGLLVGIPSLILTIFLLSGLFTLQPNMSAVLVLFGKYKGTLKTSGFWWANPFMTKIKVSHRRRNLDTDKIKVNDSRGNPIEIGSVVVWRVEDTAQATFDVEDFSDFVKIQSDAALRSLAGTYPYDVFDGDEVTLRGDTKEVSVSLQKELQERVSKAGVIVEEARLSHLAYAPEIAEAMLRRQQADAIVSARARIVEGAVGMVEMALEKLEEHNTIQLDEERKAAMVSNLLVILCSDNPVSPVVNAGTLYT